MADFLAETGDRRRVMRGWVHPRMADRKGRPTRSRRKPAAQWRTGMSALLIGDGKQLRRIRLKGRGFWCEVGDRRLVWEVGWDGGLVWGCFLNARMRREYPPRPRKPV